MVTRTRSLLLVLSLAAAPFAGGCAAPTEEDVPVEAATADLASADLLGSYTKAEGRFASLVLSKQWVDGRRVNKYEGTDLYLCGSQQDCAGKAVRGQWSARAGKLTLRSDDGGPEEFSFSLLGRSLRLVDSIGEAATLTKTVASDHGLRDALKRAGVREMSVEIDTDEVSMQASAPGVLVSFSEAVGNALDVFLDGPDGLAGITKRANATGPCASDPSGYVRCIANTPHASISLLELGDVAPGGEHTNDTWVFAFVVDGFSNQTYYVVVDKKAARAPFLYATD